MPSKPYNTTRLTNISYNSVIDEELFNRNFFFDVYALLTKNLNLFSLESKIQDKKNQDMTYMMWYKCIPTNHCRYICSCNNVTYLNGKNALHP